MAGIGVLQSTAVPLGVVMLIFAVGATSSFFCFFATGVQKGYYQNIRDLKTKLEDELALGDYALKTTRGMGGKRSRLARVTTFQTGILIAIALADLAGLGVAIQHAVRTKAQPVEVAARVVTGSAMPRQIPLVFSRQGRVVAAVSTTPGAIVTVRLTPGSYEVLALAAKVCTAKRTVGQDALQPITLQCAAAAPTIKRRGARRRRHGQ